MVAGAAPRLCLNSPTGISCFFISLQSGNQLTNPQMSGNLQGFNIQSHYQWRKPLVLHLLVTLLLINQQKHFIPPLPPPPSPQYHWEWVFSVAYWCKKKEGNLEIWNWKSISHMKCPVSLFPAMAEDFSFWTRILITLMKITMLTCENSQIDDFLSWNPCLRFPKKQLLTFMC